VVLVGVQLSVLGSYVPPVLKLPPKIYPPQITIWLPVHTAVLAPRGEGAPIVVVAVQLSVPGLYLPPVLKALTQKPSLHPPQTIISLSVHTAVCWIRPAGAPMVLVAVQPSVVGLYRPPVFKKLPPQTIISLPVQTAVCESLALGALAVLVATQLSVLVLYLPPVFK